ncbi:MAG TPA: nuclear transport factor 2 family protein [Paraburkholderia sp.]
MNRQIHHICFALTAIAVAALSSVSSAKTVANDPAAIVRSALEQWRDDFNARRAAHICDLFAPDLRYDFQGLPEQTYPLLCERLHRALADTTQSIHYGSTIKEIIVSGRLAIVRLTWTSTLTDAGGKQVTHDETGLDVFGRQADGSWKIIRYIAYPAE